MTAAPLLSPLLPPVSAASVSAPVPPPPTHITYLAYVGEKGGDAVQAFELARGMASHGAAVTLIVPDMPGLRAKADAYAKFPNLTVVCTPLIRYDTFAQNPLNVLRLLLPLRNVPVLHVHAGDICPPRLSLLFLDILRPRVLFATIHAAQPEMAVGGKRAAYWAACVRRRFRAVFCPSQHGRTVQTNYGLPQEKTRTIYNGVDTNYFASGNGAIARAQLGISSATPLVLFLSRFHEQKRPLDALRAFARAAEVVPDAHLAMVGNGPLEKEVKQAASQLPCASRIHFSDHVSNVPDYLAACDVWLLPSEAENFSLAVLESLSAGCAVVATNCVGNDEILINEENALLAPVGDTAALGDAVTRLLTNAPLRARLKSAARETAARYTLDAMTNHYQQAYADFTDGKGAVV